MTEFRVHFLKTDGDKTTHVVNAESPVRAAAIICKKNPGVIVLKVKVNKAGNVSPRVRWETSGDDRVRANHKENFQREHMLDVTPPEIIGECLPLQDFMKD